MWAGSPATATVAYGPLAVGATQVMYEGIPTYPDAGRFWKMIQDHKVTTFYTAPTAIRSLIKLGGDLPKQYDLSSLRLLGTVGEPINPEAWMWYYNTVGQARCPIVDTWWQTETGCHMIAPLPGAVPTKPGSCTLPIPGIQVAVVDETGHPVDAQHGGSLVITKPFPSQIRTIWGDPERYKKGYFPEEMRGYYLAGDSAHRDEDGYIWIMGRNDDVLKVSGHRLGTMEIESALVASPLVAEAAVVGRPHDIKGESVVAFVVLKAHAPPIRPRQKKSSRSCATGSARRSALSPNRTRSALATTCPRPVPERSCVACCAPSHKANRLRRIFRRWKTRPYWSSSKNAIE